ncbi:hypothetical protein NPIL_383831 [Nephila pilipes]|uniref:Uncharacterized protein n=1 Tax=Nephila pilipes TaxID=299642 RepID=A0A8X6QDN4_NEPPI|nr:hypothetical protein NPIL_142661 [Nephila pilipes]GFU08856.1 hypothetical protein NPIL_383831 [Nephila pilipes]
MCSRDFLLFVLTAPISQSLFGFSTQPLRNRGLILVPSHAIPFSPFYPLTASIPPCASSVTCSCRGGSKCLSFCESHSGSFRRKLAPACLKAARLNSSVLSVRIMKRPLTMLRSCNMLR